MKNKSKLPDSHVNHRNARKVIASGVKALRKKLGLTQHGMALRAGVSERSVRRYENRETDAQGVPFMKILRLCTDAESLLAFGIDIKKSVVG